MMDLKKLHEFSWKNNQNFVDVSFLGSGFKECCLFWAPEKKKHSDTMIPKCFFWIWKHPFLQFVSFFPSPPPPKKKQPPRWTSSRVGSRRRLGWRTGALKKPMAALRLLGRDGELGWVGGGSVRETGATSGWLGYIPGKITTPIFV